MQRYLSKVKIKLNLYYTRLIPFRVLRVSGAHLRGFAPRSRTIKVATVANHWQREGDLIGSGFEPHTSRTRSERKSVILLVPL